MAGGVKIYRTTRARGPRDIVIETCRLSDATHFGARLPRKAMHIKAKDRYNNEAGWARHILESHLAFTQANTVSATA